MSNDLRALFVLPSFNRSGAVDFVVDLAGAMTDCGCGTTILALDGRDEPARRPAPSVAVTSAVRGVGRSGSRSPVLRRLRHLLDTGRMLRALLRACRSADVVFLTWEKGRALGLPALAAWLTGTPTIGIVQNNIDHSTAGPGDMLRRLALRLAYARAAAVVCVSNDLLPVVERLGVNRRKLVGIPNAIDVERVRRLARAENTAAAGDDERPYIVGVGRLAEQKGFDLLIRAHAAVLRQGVEHRLVLIGHGPDKASLRALAKFLGVSESVEFRGYDPNPYPAMAGAAAFCLSSRYEGRALTLAEAASLGVPTIAANCPAGPMEVLDGGRFGELVAPLDVTGLADAIERHLRFPAALEAKARAAAQRAEALDIRQCAARYASLARACLAMGGALEAAFSDASVVTDGRVASNEALVQVVEKGNPEGQVERVA